MNPTQRMALLLLTVATITNSAAIVIHMLGTM